MQAIIEAYEKRYLLIMFFCFWSIEEALGFAKVDVANLAKLAEIRLRLLVVVPLQWNWNFGHKL